jgi:hypothetical protein
MGNRVSIRNVVGISWERMKNLLFRPFELAKWIILGFCAWVVTLGGQNGGSGGNLPSNVAQSSRNASENFWGQMNYLLNSPEKSFLERMAEIFDTTSTVIVAITIAVIFVFILVAALVVLFTWLRFRFEFVFLDNLVHNRAKVSAPWREFKAYAHSLWGNYLLILLVFAVVNVFLFLPIFLLGMGHWMKRCAAASDILMPNSSEIFTLVLIVILFFAWGLAFTFWQFFMEHFQIPVMYQKKMLFKESSVYAWRLVKENPGVFIRFLLMVILIDIIFGICIVLGIFLSCCFLLLLLVIPVINTTVMLPYLALKRYLGVDLLAALAPDLSPYPIEKTETIEQPGNA